MATTDTQQAAQFSAEAAVSAAEAKQYLIEAQQGYQDTSAAAQEAKDAAAAAATSEQNATYSEANAAQSAAAAVDAKADAEAAASSASDYAKNKFTFYKTASDPDGTIAGLAATTDGQSFWVAQGPDALSAAWQYQNKAGVAVLQAKQPGTAAITGTIREFPTLEAAQADADAGNIPVGSTAYYRIPDDSALAIEVINNGGTLSKTGRSMQSSAYTDSIFDPLSEAVNANFNSLVAVMTENMALKETLTATGQLNSDKNSVLLFKSGSLVFGGNVPALISAVSDDNKMIFSRKIYPGESFANGVWRTPYRDYTFKASPDEISSVTIGDTVTIIVMLSALTPDAWFDGASNTVFSDGFTTMSQGAQAGASVNSVAGGDGGTVRFGVLNSDITGAGYELTAAGVTGYFANTFNNIAVYYRAVAPSLYIDTEISGVFNGLATVTIESPATAVIEQYTYPEKEVMAPATPVGVYNADIKNITGRSLTGVPSEVAIQFSPGEVSTQAALRLTDENGTEYPCQFAGDMDANLRRESDIARYVDNSFNTGKIIFFADIPANTSRKFRLETYGARGKTAAEWNYPKLTRNLTTDRWEITVGDFTWEFLTSTGALASVRKGDASIGV
ncbi:TPA: hypothetical protein ACXNKJ_005112, partial [Klebsiella pneumoniae]